MITYYDIAKKFTVHFLTIVKMAILSDLNWFRSHTWSRVLGLGGHEPCGFDLRNPHSGSQLPIPLCRFIATQIRQLLACHIIDIKLTTLVSQQL